MDLTEPWAANLASAHKSLARNRKSFTGVAATKETRARAVRQCGRIFAWVAVIGNERIAVLSKSVLLARPWMLNRFHDIAGGDVVVAMDEADDWPAEVETS